MGPATMNLPLAVMLAALTAGSIDEDAQPNDRALRTYSRNHVELSFGYLGQWSDERNRALELKPSSTDPAVAGSITDPFLGRPFNGTALVGATFETRFVCDHVRVTLGARFPFANYRPSDTAQTVIIGGQSHDVLVRSVSLWDLRTGLGFELPFRRVTPFVDVLGDVQTMSAQLTIDGVPANYTGRAFSLGGRVGARVQVSHLFIALAAEATALGPLRVGGTLQLGFAF
jgi:hypothetical protein